MEQAMGEIVQQPQTAEAKVAAMERGASWFFWISALSVINSLSVTFGGLSDMLFGLGGTRVVDETFRQSTLAGVNSAGLSFNLAIAGLFALLGFYARKGSDIAFVLGIFLYAIDAMILIGFRDVFAFGFHLVALFYMFNGLLASRRRRDPSV